MLSRSITEITPRCLLDLLEIVPKPQYLSEYLKREEDQLSLLEEVELLERAVGMGIQPFHLKGHFLRMLKRHHKEISYIIPEHCHKVVALGQLLGV